MDTESTFQSTEDSKIQGMQNQPCYILKTAKAKFQGCRITLLSTEDSKIWGMQHQLCYLQKTAKFEECSTNFAIYWIQQNSRDAELTLLSTEDNIIIVGMHNQLWYLLKTTKLEGSRINLAIYWRQQHYRDTVSTLPSPEDSKMVRMQNQLCYLPAEGQGS